MRSIKIVTIILKKKNEREYQEFFLFTFPETFMLISHHILEKNLQEDS